MWNVCIEAVSTCHNMCSTCVVYCCFKIKEFAEPNSCHWSQDLPPTALGKNIFWSLLQQKNSTCFTIFLRFSARLTLPFRPRPEMDEELTKEMESFGSTVWSSMVRLCNRWHLQFLWQPKQLPRREVRWIEQAKEEVAKMSVEELEPKSPSISCVQQNRLDIAWLRGEGHSWTRRCWRRFRQHADCLVKGS